MIKISLLGATGRMGQSISQCLKQHPRCILVASCGSPQEGETESVIKAGDVVMDFTTPAAFDSHLNLAIHLNTPIVIGTTGLSSEQKDRLSQAAQIIPIVYTTNTSIGITVLAALVQQAAKQLDLTYDIEIVETHHRHKIDAPSGTALSLGEAAAKGRGVSIEDVKAQGLRQGERVVGDIGFSVQRGGNLAGEHSVRFLGDDEIIDLTHRGLSRSILAKGAIRAAEWLPGHAPGLYNMRDVLGI